MDVPIFMPLQGLDLPVALDACAFNQSGFSYTNPREPSYAQSMHIVSVGCGLPQLLYKNYIFSVVGKGSQ